MFFRRVVPGLVAVFLLSTLICNVTAQSSRSIQTPDQKQRRAKAEPNNAFLEWPEKDVSLIITPDELKAYQKLQTDEEREQFIRIFWDARDPDPDTEENEYKEEYYERIAYANEHFASGKPGWMTDRGRIYIKFGKPDQIESYPTGGSYQRLPHEGGGSTSTYPFERWFYRHIPGVRSGIDIEFVDPTGSGEFRLARSLNEKDALLNVPGAGPTLDELSGRITRADRIAGMGGYRREQDSPFAIAELHYLLDLPPEVKRSSFDRTRTGMPAVDYDSLNFDIEVNYFRQSDNRVLAAFTIQTDNKDLVFQEQGGLPTARLNIIGKITTIAARRVGGFEDAVITTALPGELIAVKDRKSAYAKAVMLAPGRYRLDVMVRDVESGAAGIRSYAFLAPAYPPNKLAVSSLILTSKLERDQRHPELSPFTIGRNKVVPNLSKSYRRGQSAGIYLQVYNAGIDQTTLRPSVDVEYVLMQSGREISRQIEDWRGLSEAGDRLTLARLIGTQELAPGQYQLEIRIRDHVTGQTLTPSTSFTITHQ